MGLKKPEAFVLISVFLVTLCTAVNPTWSDDSPVSTGALSRKKRYLTFPSGSILQLGYCLTVPTIIPDGIWSYGITFGTNWEIPTDPVGLKVPKDAEVVHRRQRRDLYQKLRPMMDILPRRKLSSDSADDDLIKYDAAYKTKADCEVLFPSCLKDLDVS